MKNIFIILILLFGLPTLAEDGGGPDKPSQLGFSLGKVLPNGVTEEDEIFSLWGARYSYPASTNGFYDFGGYMGKSNGVDWMSAFASVSMHIPIETLIGHAGLGLDYTKYESKTDPAASEIGGHFIGGVMSKIGGNLLARFDMKLNSKPGTSLFFGVGLVFNLEGGSDAGGAQ